MSKVTTKARKRIAARSLQDQLKAHSKEILVTKQDTLTTVDTGPDLSWAGQHARLSNPKKLESYEPYID